MLDFKSCFKQIIVLLVVSIILMLFMGVMLDKPSIHDASIEELISIEYIGEVRAESILDYLENNPDSTAEDLINVDGVGEVILKKIKRRYK